MRFPIIQTLGEFSIATADTPFKFEALIWVQAKTDAKYPIAGNQCLNHFSEFIYRLREDLNAWYEESRRARRAVLKMCHQWRGLFTVR